MRYSLLSTGLAGLLFLATPSASPASPVAAPASSARTDTAKLLDYLFTLLMLRE